VNILVTSSRMPFALDEIRKFGRAGHRVFAADSVGTAPGSHSRWTAGSERVASPEFSPRRFVTDIMALVRHRDIELVVPCFEEVFHLARHLPELSSLVPVFASDFEPLVRLHHKAEFNRLAREAGCPTPRTTVVESRSELRAALRLYSGYFARPAWSRGGLDLLTNCGPLAGTLAVDDCRPTRRHPWIVQEYVDGLDVCSFSIVHHGRVAAHCSYVHPKEIDHAGGIVFESIDDRDTLRVAERVAEATGYHGQLSLDFHRGSRGLVVFECNPRPTAGVHLMPDDMFVEAMLAPGHHVRVVPAGARRKYATALIRDMLLHWREIREDLAYLLSDAADVYSVRHDRWPALYQLLSYILVLRYRRRHPEPAQRRRALKAAYFDGIMWNGEAIP
jgi:hypothetical protein